MGNKILVRYAHKFKWCEAYFKTKIEADAFAYGVGIYAKWEMYEHTEFTDGQGKFLVLHGGVWKMIDAKED